MKTKTQTKTRTTKTMAQTKAKTQGARDVPTAYMEKVINAHMPHFPFNDSRE